MVKPALFLRLVHGLDRTRLVKPHVVVSAGGSTLGANVALSRIWDVPNIFSGSTRGYPLEAFRLVLSPYAHAAVAPNVVAGPKPTPFDPDSLPLPRRIRSPEDIVGARISVLVGGPTPYAAFGHEDWERLAALVEGLVFQQGCCVTVVTSPRTPESAYAHLTPLARLTGSVSVVDYRSSGPGSIEAAFDCDALLITSDSMSMMTEAAVSRRPAVALAPRIVQASKDDEAVSGLVAARWLAVLPLAETGVDTLARAIAALEPIAHNHLDRLAERLFSLIEFPPSVTY